MGIHWFICRKKTTNYNLIEVLFKIEEAFFFTRVNSQFLPGEQRFHLSRRKSLSVCLRTLSQHGSSQLFSEGLNLLQVNYCYRLQTFFIKVFIETHQTDRYFLGSLSKFFHLVTQQVAFLRCQKLLLHEQKLLVLVK